MATAKITVADVRRFLLDKPEANTLIDGVRWTDEDIDKACIDVIDAYNVIPPPVGFVQTVEQFPLRYLLLIGVTGHLLRGAAVSEASNQLTYSAEGVQVADRDRAQIFTELGNSFWKDFLDMSKQVKISQNVNALLGGKGSEYGWGPSY
ncbi:hypothetical protein EKK58_01430 [Candidatus Dependentiae bacterium]|nr:MAG: hypothetical protein EKK58_01430 [Candidatus Dependentiae bacterium]